MASGSCYFQLMAFYMLISKKTRCRFYVLLGVCFLAKKVEWLRQEALLNAGFLIPLLAAIHGIVLAAVHDDGNFE